ncbi:phosphotransferase enzyme family protein [Nocardia sp. NPDC057227]|uniref:phosphotransferase enzyme family protein n=1 Tax=Nocardia sp. NPDC057227 TaxID=3346056 RepID=UPI003636C51D
MAHAPHTAIDDLRADLAAICAVVDLDPRGAILIKYTNNAVWQLATAPMVVRIGMGAVGRFRAPRVTAIARWLTDHDAPIPHLVPGIDQPILTADTAATIWQTLARPERAWEPTDLAEPLRTLHALDAGTAPDQLPRWNPFDAAARRLGDADPALPADDLDWLREQWATVEARYRRLPALPRGVVHGDAHTGNLLRDHDGRVVLCDLDSAGHGPLAWDLATNAVDARRFGRPDDHTRLAHAYGQDITTSPAWPVLRRIRELILVTSVIPDLTSRPGVATEHARRLRALRTHDSIVWQPYN